MPGGKLGRPIVSASNPGALNVDKIVDAGLAHKLIQPHMERVARPGSGPAGTTCTTQRLRVWKKCSIHIASSRITCQADGLDPV